ncbi:MAG TPA: FAD/NAD(P)-binding oxidoreductase [Acidimicrobiales bacterium]|nr:FAD/NAD(P)-binding oxidoreductase [Acidimicrobiales bacterium]
MIGGGTAGTTVAARLRRSGVDDVAMVEPSGTHWYQPLWTLVGGGLAPISESARPQSRVVPRGVRWVQDHAVEIDPDRRLVATSAGGSIGYDFLVVAPGIQLDWGAVPGLEPALGHHGVSSNYRSDLAPRTWDFIRDLRSGTALFTAPSTPVKCGGAAQKIAFLAADWWRRQGVLGDIRVVLALPGTAVFGVPEFRRVLEQVIDRYGIELRLGHELVEVDAAARQAVLADSASGTRTRLPYDLLHAVPPQSAPDFLKGSPVAAPGEAAGWVEVDRSTLRHPRYPEVFSLGDASSAPTSRTGSAVRKQAPVLVANLLAVMAGGEPAAAYDGYSSCPFTTARNRVLMAEFDYTLRPHPTVPFVDTTKERYDMWLLKRYGLPFIYWNLMLRGLA